MRVVFLCLRDIACIVLVNTTYFHLKRSFNAHLFPLFSVFISGTVVPSKTKIAYHFSTLVLVYGQQHTLQIEPRDEYGNPTSNSTSLIDEVNYSVHVHSVRTQYHDTTLIQQNKFICFLILDCEIGQWESILCFPPLSWARWMMTAWRSTTVSQCHPTSSCARYC